MFTEAIDVVGSTAIFQLSADDLIPPNTLAVAVFSFVIVSMAVSN